MSAFFDPGVLRLNWAQLRASRALPCVVSIAAILAAGIACGRPDAGMVAAGGAMSVGFGSFQWLGRSRVRPMLWAALGMSVSALGGSLVGHSGPGTVVNAAWAGFGGGMLLALGPGSSWIGQQCAIVALVASGYPVGMDAALSRAGLILAGGVVQTGVVLAVWRWRSPDEPPETPDPYSGLLPAVSTLWNALSLRSETCRFSIRLGATLGLGAGLAHAFGLGNGYWVPMTAFLVLKPDFRQTFHRGLERVVGTVAGALLATLLVRFLHLDAVSTGALVAGFAWLAYSLTNVNYALYAVCLTSYIVFLLDFGGLSPANVVHNRALNTTLGGALAMLSYVTVLIRRRSAGVLKNSTP